MLARVSLSQDTETLPELTERQSTRQGEEKLWGLESVHMADSETVCAAPRLYKLEPECVSAHGGVSDVHHTHSPIIKTETDLGSPHTEYLIKTEGLDSAELQCMSSLHSDQIKTESVDGGYFKEEDIIKVEDILSVNIKSDHIKYESCKYLVSDVMNTVLIGAAVGVHDQTESGQCAGETNQTCRNDVSEKRYGCTWCGKCFLRKGALEIHERIHTGEKPYKCTECGMCFSHEGSLNSHMIIHSGEKPYTCTQCGIGFSHKRSLNLHKMVHTGEKPYKCTECGMCFSHKGSLNSHMIIHSGEKPYTCTQCGIGISHKRSLNSHMMIHSGEKPYKCTQCEKCFSQKSHLNEHKKVHSGEKPYRCTHCGKCFALKSTITKHMRTHTGGKPYKCTECEKCFSQKGNLNKHKRGIHSG